MRKLKHLLATLLLLCCTAVVFCQTTGQVTDGSTGQPISGATVTVKGSDLSGATDAQGKFTIAAKVGQTLIVSFVGYEKNEQVVKGATVNISLKTAHNNLNEVVVVGYGRQKKVNLTGAISAVKGEELASRQTGDAVAALQGLAPGLTIRQQSGQPGDNGSTFMRIRGEGSINSSSYPLVLVDGVEMDFSQVDMATVESISVLKDAASASIYGSRAANGVILVTTKRGINTNGKAKLSISSYVGNQQATNMPEPVSAVEYMQLINQANKNAGANPQYSDQVINDYINLGPDNKTRYATDWRNLVMKDNALMHNTSFTLTAGSDKLRSTMSGSYFYQNGLISNNNYNRFTLRANTDYSMNDWIKFNLDVNFRDSRTVTPSLNTPKSIIRKAMSFVPVFSGINDDGTWGYGQNGDNPIAVSKAAGTNNTRVPEVVLTGGVTLTPFKGFTSSTFYTVRTSTTRGTTFIKPYDTYEGGTFKATYPPDGTQGGESWDQTIYKLFRSQLNYTTTLRKHEIGVLAGVQTEETKNSGFSAGRKNYAFPGYVDLNNGDPATATNTGSESALAMASFFGRINYNYAGKYLLELNGRFDASSRFSRSNWWAFFPSVSAGWRISEEKFMDALKPVLSNLKIRGSLGLLGNQSLSSYYPSTTQIAPGYSYWFDKQLSSGGAQTTMGNSNIQWEKSRQFDIGLDGGFFNNRLTVTFDYYRKYIYDLLQQLPVPYYVGLSAPYVNAGSMENKGWELSLGYNNKIGKLGYSVTANLADVKNKVLDLHGRSYITNTIIKEGYAINSYYGYKSNGYFQSTDDVTKSPTQFNDKANTKPGYIKYQDVNGSGAINDSDRVVLGNPFPRYEYSFDLKLNYKGFDLDVFLQGVGKRQAYMSGYGAQPFYVGSTIFKSQADTWTTENPNAAYPLLLIDGSGVNPNYKISDKWVGNAAYLRLKMVTLGYTLPKSLTDRAKIGSVRFYLSGQNLLTLSHFMKGYDVETAVSSGEFYPLMRTTTFGVNLNF